MLVLGRCRCPDTGGLQVLVCNDTRIRKCAEQPLQDPPFANQYYSTSQLEWKWVQVTRPDPSPRFHQRKVSNGLCGDEEEQSDVDDAMLRWLPRNGWSVLLFEVMRG
eukprot:2873114-Rhodomonas_salina.1